VNNFPVVLYTILATHSRSDHVTHTVRVFTSVENAESLLPRTKSSHDYDCTWNYSICVYDRPVTDVDPESVDPEYINNYPYSGL
jgi:hypothetical protein